MKNNKFVIKTLPNISESLSFEVKGELELVKENYKTIRDNLYTILNYCLKNNIIKPIVYYNLFFYVEISLKYYLLIISDDLTIKEIENYGHGIYELINAIKKYDDFSELSFLLNKFIDRNDNKLNLDKYFNFKYNKLIGNNELIFDFYILPNDKKNINEVIKWLDSHI